MSKNQDDYNEHDKKYGYCSFRDEDGYCYFDKSDEDIESGYIDICDNIYKEKRVCTIY